MKNESAYPLHESVEVYVKYKNAQPGEPGFQLKGIACVELQAGEEKEVSVTLHARDFAVITEDGGCVVRRASMKSPSADSSRAKEAAR